MLSDRRRGALVLFVALGLVAASCRYVHPPFNGRLDQPVVLTGADLPSFLGHDPGRLVAYRFAGSPGAWGQLPVQVDQRVVVPFGAAPGNNGIPGVAGTVYGYGDNSVTALQYADPNTFVGADPDPMIDANDEIVFMARDAGNAAPNGTGAPAGVVPGSGKRINLADHDDGRSGVVYLFEGQPGADPSAGQDYVKYKFSLDSGDYKSTYLRADGPNPEHSTVEAQAYRLGIIDRWKTVDLRVGGGNGADILDGFKAQFSFTTCGRSNATFADAEGAFVANIDGPVRAIRAYVGANSGPLVQETNTYYADRVESAVDLRVHAIPSVMSFIDFSPAATGMKYGNSSQSGTVTIDGTQDTVSATPPAWQYAVGPQGALTWATKLETSIPNLTTTFEWRDQSPPTPPAEDCWGDDTSFYGVGATLIGGGIPNTDPRTVPFGNFRSSQVTAFWGPALDAASWTPAWAADAMQPLDVTISSF
ncbi:MAG: hypothetical protein JJE46_06445 [Acidimicrobiia bacterium]|nr:hypothetical protein [Acidimicrobiia bacterium]